MRTTSSGPGAVGGHHEISPLCGPDITTTAAGSLGCPDSGHRCPAAQETRKIRTCPLSNSRRAAAARRAAGARAAPYGVRCARTRSGHPRGTPPNRLWGAVREPDRAGLHRLARDLDSGDVFARDVSETDRAAVGHIHIDG